MPTCKRGTFLVQYSNSRHTYLLILPVAPFKYIALTTKPRANKPLGLDASLASGFFELSFFSVVFLTGLLAAVAVDCLVCAAEFVTTLGVLVVTPDVAG